VLLYLDQRIRKEGLDLELSKFLEDRQVGQSGTPDPFFHGGSGPARSAGVPPALAPHSESGNGSPWG
jgi:hypothetical protein